MAAFQIAQCTMQDAGTMQPALTEAHTEPHTSRNQCIPDLIGWREGGAHRKPAMAVAAGGWTKATTWGSMENTKEPMSRGPMPEGVMRSGR